MNWYNNHPTKVKNIIAEWDNILSQDSPERIYQTFLSDHAGLFFGNENCHLVISRLKLGSELETDFVTLTDGFSNGNVFELIEIKQPSAKLFTDKGTMTYDFNRAIQQIRDWKRWLIDNKTWFKNFLPTNSTRVQSDSNLKFKIIIGRRQSNPFDIEKRNQIAEEIGAEIRSFDYLTDKLKSRQFYPNAWLSDDIDNYEEQLANPFYKSTTDSEWKIFCKSQRVAGSHFYSHHYLDIIEDRKYSIDFE